MRASLGTLVLVGVISAAVLSASGGAPGAGGTDAAFHVEKVFGGAGWIGREMHVPADVFVDELAGCFYVTQWRNSYVKKFRLDGTFLATFGEGRAWGGAFGNPYGIAGGPDGRLYLTLDWRCTVFVMSSDGRKVKVFSEKGSGDGQLDRPKGIARSPVNGLFYVVDRYNFRIQVFDADGNLKNKWGAMGSKPGEFYLARGIAIDEEGTVYVADTFNHRVQVFTAEGKFLRSIGRRGGGAGEFKFPSGVAVSREGTLFVTDAGNGRIVWFTKEGEFLGAFGRRGTRPGEFNQPLGVAVDSGGRLWVADTMNHRVQVLAPEGGAR